jgi:hypothetical protein
MLKRRILKVAVAVIFAAVSAGGLAVAGSGAALAATAAASQAVTPAVAQAPAVQCPVVLHRFTTYNPDCGHVSGSRACSIGNQGNFSTIPNYAANGCIYRVWLYSGVNETGSSPLCLSPTRSSTGFLTVIRRSFRIVSNQDPC